MLACIELLASEVKLTDEAEESEEQKHALSDKTRIRGVDWGDFKDEAMADNFDPSFWFVSILHCLFQLIDASTAFVFPISISFHFSTK